MIRYINIVVVASILLWLYDDPITTWTVIVGLVIFGLVNLIEKMRKKNERV